MITGARLVDLAGTELLRFGPDPLRLQRLTLGYPDIRASATARPGRDGEYDTTAYHGASAITLELAVQDNGVVGRDVWVARIRGYLAPGLRSWLYVASTDWPVERRILVRGDQAPVVFDAPGTQKIQVGLRAPDGVMESTVEQSLVLYPTTGAQGGITFPVTFPVSFAAGNVPNAANVTNGGTVEALPYVDIYGYCTNPIIRNLTTGEQFGFVGLTVQAGDFIRVDMRERVTLLTNDRGQSRYSLVDFTTSDWWGLKPGTSLVAFIPGTPGMGCQAVLYFRDTTI